MRGNHNAAEQNLSLGCSRNAENERMFLTGAQRCSRLSQIDKRSVASPLRAL